MTGWNMPPGTSERDIPGWDDDEEPDDEEEGDAQAEADDIEDGDLYDED